MVLGISLLLSVPALRPVLRAIREISPWWIAAAVALELASCVSFVIIFRLFFDRVGAPDARALAWTEMASGALLPGGGVGGYAIGGWLMHLTGAPTPWIVGRSSGLFFLTSAVNSAAMIVAGLLLLAGAAGPHDFARAALPALLAGAATLIVLALPWIAHHRRSTVPVWLDGVVVGIRDAERTAAHPSWRLVGALGYPGFDMAVLWVAFSAVGHAPRSQGSSWATRSATSPTRCPSRAGSACSTRGAPARCCCTAHRRCTWSRPCSSTTQSRSGSPRQAASLPTPACADASQIPAAMTDPAPPPPRSLMPQPLFTRRSLVNALRLILKPSPTDGPSA